ncbi:TolB family protein [Microlunatus soli]|uniref:WD40-like Beta Propeller Repeat n=1 Tax=Microlunatus soli TaxID=630515 RepID=A0A1H1TX01_9ACTN|nr:PD40 domain-containing protein [Microlunatus soli]SDS64742.1 WD40-like Beta Propeller Repeat [Microlunatus soli]
MAYRSLHQDQVARIHVHDAADGTDTVIFEDPDVLLEAPNWSLDGRALLLNGNGVLWSLAPEAGSSPATITHDGLPDINNDHVLDPDGESIYLSAADGHIYRAALSGGPVTKITPDDGLKHYLHGVSPDSKRLAYVQMSAQGVPGVLMIIPATGGEPTLVDTGAGHIDGPEWSPDGQWLYLNSEHWATEPGHAQVCRIRESGGTLERLVESGTVDWFPHLSPDGSKAVYIEFPTGTQGHPADLPVNLVVVNTTDWTTPLERISLPGGQGTINVNSWSPDSTRFAYVSYPIGAA